MKFKPIPFLIFIVNLIFFVQTDVLGNNTVCDSSTFPCYRIIDNLNKRIDSLEARLENLQIQVIESDPFKSAKYLHWGKGITFSTVKSEPRITFDAGYTFSTARLFRLGIAAGFDGELGAATILPHYGVYGKVMYGTPVFVNFMSINGYTRALLYPKDARTYKQTARAGVNSGVELEFWLSPAWCYTFGGSVTVLNGHIGADSKVAEINFIGFKYFPQVRRKKR